MSTNLVPREMPIVGPPHLVREALATQARQGRLLSKPSEIVVRPVGNGEISILVRLLVPERLSWRKRNPLLFGSLVALVIAAGIFAAGWLAVAAVAKAAAAVDGPAAIGALIIVGALLLAALANRSNHRGACPGIAVHCKGCKR